MPEYLYPGVYVEEVSARGKSIEGVSTSTAGFVGPVRFGPIGLKPCVITNLQEFERIYGDGGQLVFADSGQMHNYLWHAVRAFFAEGGRRLYIARAFLPRGNDDDGVASCNVPADGGTAALRIRARFPGAAGNFLVRFIVRLGANIPSGAADVDIAVSVLLNDGSMRVWDHVPPDPAHLLAIFGTAQSAVPLTIIPGENVTNGTDVLNALFAAKPSLRAALDDPHSTESDRSVDVLLSGGNDGARPTSDVFRGGLQAFEDVEEISIVGAPGATSGYRDGFKEEADRIVDHLIAHAERMRYRIAVLDSGDGLDISEVRGMRAKLDSRSAALYYPWVRTRDPITGQDIDLAPSGFVAGVYARNDIEKGVSKAPANQVVNLATRLETVLSDTQQEALNLEGINCLRTFVGRGVVVWGARTISSDTEWKYVGIRRYFAYLEHSLDRGTQWTVFEPNGEGLWAKVQRNIEAFLLNEWQTGALMGDKPERAFFVRCDRSTMTQSDLDNGQLVCLIGVAPVRPAEFMILRIGQWTADRRC